MGKITKQELSKKLIDELLSGGNGGPTIELTSTISDDETKAITPKGIKTLQDQTIQALALKYEKPEYGIPWADLDDVVQDTLLEAMEVKPIAESKYTKPVSGIPITDLDKSTQDAISAGGSGSMYAENVTKTDKSNATGFGTTATGRYSHAEGDKTFAGSQSAHSEGFRTVASASDYATIESVNNSAKTVTLVSGSTLKLTVDSLVGIHKGDNTDGLYNIPVKAIDGLVITLGTTSMLSSECLYLYTPTQASSMEGTHSEGFRTLSLGRASHAEGYRTHALGIAAHSEGVDTVAQGIGSHAEGTFTFVQGNYSHAEGSYTKAIGSYGAHAEGANTEAVGNSSHAEGERTEAIGVAAHAEGLETVASGNHSHTEGEKTKASGENSHAEGYYTQASARASHAEGYGTKATGNESHTEGQSTTASGSQSHAEGVFASATNDQAHAEGYDTLASGFVSHAEGRNTVASGSYAHAKGYYTVANVFGGQAMGSYNKVMLGDSMQFDATADVFVIGGGASEPSRANAFRVTADGKTYGKSAFNSTGADYAEYFEWLDGNTEAEERQGFFVTIDGNKLRKANSNDDYILGIVSVNPSVIGDSHQDDWNDKYVTDVWGRIQYEYVDVPEVTRDILTGQIMVDGEIQDIIETIVEQHARRDYVPILNPNWDNEEAYIPREQRLEWAPVGIVGKLLVRDDGTCQVNGYCKTNDEGIATTSNTGYRVMERIAPNIIKVFIK